MIIAVLIAFGLGMALNMLISDWDKAKTDHIINDLDPIKSVASVHSIERRKDV